MLRNVLTVCMSVCITSTLAAQEPASRSVGVLLLAHGGSASWDANVRDIAGAVDAVHPTEVAFGMASRLAIQAAVDRLESRGVTSIVAVPLFISSHSSVITSTEYLLGAREEMPQALHAFAKMQHGAGHGGHRPDPHGTKPINTNVRVRMATALDAHPLVAAIVADRAASVSRTAAHEAVVLVAHGPVSDGENARWVSNLTAIGARVANTHGFASVDGLTVRDDAPTPIRDAATRELRALVEKRRAEGRRVLIVPVLLSYGGIEAGIRERLDGLDYALSRQALAPDARLATWVLEQVGSVRQ